MAQDIILDSLEEIEFHLMERGDEYMEVLKRLLSIISIRKLKNVEINVPYPYNAAASLRGDKVYQKVRHICPPNIGVKLNVSPSGR